MIRALDGVVNSGLINLYWAANEGPIDVASALQQMARWSIGHTGRWRSIAKSTAGEHFCYAKLRCVSDLSPRRL